MRDGCQRGEAALGVIDGTLAAGLPVLLQWADTWSDHRFFP